MKLENVYMTIRQKGHVGWAHLPQFYLGYMDWNAAIKLARIQSYEVRLCTSFGYDNQGHYISPPVLSS
jgi:hypothetical protein